MQMSHRFVIVLAAVAACAAASLPYAGKWKMNLAKSDFGEETITFTQAGPGQMQYSADGMSYTFRMDGKDYPSLLGRTAAWKQIDPHTWETTSKLNGKVLSTTTRKLSADGATLTEEAKGPKPAGGTFDETTVYQRVSGGPGLPGKWRTKNYKSSSPDVMELAASGADGLTLTIADYQATCNAKFDGKDYAATGPTLPAGLTLAIQKTGPRSFDMTEKQDGKALYKSTFTVSADGKTLTETGSAVGVSEKYTAVYDRQ
jgi:hypothetical protein